MAVTTLEIKARGPFAQGMAFGEVGPYQQLDGTVHFAVDPEYSSNTGITDLKLAPRDANGLVHCSADFRILKPATPQRGGYRLLLDVLNRGRQRALAYFNLAPDRPTPSAPLEPGDGFLMRQGYTVVWCGWQHDVPDVAGLMRINVPDALENGRPISGQIVVTFQPNTSIQVQGLSDRLHRAYPAKDLNDREAVLMVRDHEDSPPQIVPRQQWSFARLEGGRVVPDATYIYMAAGFLPGKVYQVIYTTIGAPVVGLGLLATRDIVSFLRYSPAREGNPCADQVQYAYSFGASQSGRFLRQFLHLGLNLDEQEQMVFDGLIPHISGARRGEFNLRFGQPSSGAKQSPGNLFPFHDKVQTEPETGRFDGLLARLASKVWLVAGSKVPKVFFTNSSAEYWGGHAALIHTNLDGTRDVAPSESVRVYHFAGTQHGSGTFPLTNTNAADGARGQQLFNCVDYRPLLRAALVRLDRWVTAGETPAPSRHLRIDDRTKVPPEETAATFRKIPGVQFPAHLRYIARLDFGPEIDAGVITKLPPSVGKPYANLVSAVDEDGNELAGVRLPDISVPLATHTGWNLRHPDMGGPGQVMSLIGSTIPFAATRAEREASDDPRPSIEERYASKEDYLRQVRQAAQSLVDQGYLLAEDIQTVADQASQPMTRSRVG